MWNILHTVPKSVAAFELTKDIPYLALTGELWEVFGEYFGRNDRVIWRFYCNWHDVTAVVKSVTFHTGSCIIGKNHSWEVRSKFVHEIVTNVREIVPPNGLFQ